MLWATQVNLILATPANIDQGAHCQGARVLTRPILLYNILELVIHQLRGNPARSELLRSEASVQAKFTTQECVARGASLSARKTTVFEKGTHFSKRACSRA